MQMALVVGAALWYWRTPVAQLPPGLILPFNTLMSAPHMGLFKDLGFVAAGPFCYLCARASTAIVSAALPGGVTKVLMAARTSTAQEAAPGSTHEATNHEAVHAQGTGTLQTKKDL